ncbi:MAG: hypothetical protein PHP74_03620 [Candidatus Gracilibacteria bacterium]|nr:hypothetical protein [Candidatus Gracilibacteria bacterium]
MENSKIPITEISSTMSCKTKPTAFLNTADLHKQFLLLGRERNKITYKLLALLPQIYKRKIYEKHGFATIYEYAGKLAGLSHSTVEKSLKLEKKLENKPLLQKAIETRGVHKVAIIANLATPETEKMFVDKITNMSKPALQQLSKELRGKITGKIQTTWQIEMDEEMMKMFLKLKKNLGKFGSELSNKEAMRRMLKKWEEMSEGKEPKVVMGKNVKPQTQAKKKQEIPGENKRCPSNLTCHSREGGNLPQFSATNSIDSRLRGNDTATRSTRFARFAPASRYIPIAKKRLILAQTNGGCAHPNCQNPAQIFHHQQRFFQTKNHESIISLCKIHHEFAHNGITEIPTEADRLYRKYRQTSLIGPGNPAQVRSRRHPQKILASNGLTLALKDGFGIVGQIGGRIDKAQICSKIKNLFIV